MSHLGHSRVGVFGLPIMFGALMDLPGIRSSALVLMHGLVWVPLLWVYRTQVSVAALRGSKVRAYRVHGQASTFNQGKS